MKTKRGIASWLVLAVVVILLAGGGWFLSQDGATDDLYPPGVTSSVSTGGEASAVKNKNNKITLSGDPVTLVIEQNIKPLTYYETKEDGGEARLLTPRRTNNQINKHAKLPIYRAHYTPTPYTKGSMVMSGVQYHDVESITNEDLIKFLDSNQKYFSYARENFGSVNSAVYRLSHLKNYYPINFIWRSGNNIVYVGWATVTQDLAPPESFDSQNAEIIARGYLEIFPSDI